MRLGNYIHLRMRWGTLRRLGRLGMVFFACSCAIFILFLVALLSYYSFGLPRIESLSDYNPPQVTRMVDKWGRVVAELYDEKRTVVSLAKISFKVRQAFLAAEDAQFYQHPGLDFAGMLRALFRNLKAGRVVEGGSTITQQVIKTLLLGPERSFTRKIREVLLALRLESNLTKDEILSLYLNQISFGHRCYGVQEASHFYFGKDIENIELYEAALLAALPKSPARYSPIRHPKRAVQRRNWVLDQMEKNGFIAKKQALKAKAKELSIVAKAVNFYETAPFYAEHARRMLEKAIGRDRLYRGGLLVKLAMDLDVQKAAQKAVLQGLRQIDRRQGFRAPIGRIESKELAALSRSEETVGSEIGVRVWSLIKNARSGKWKAHWVDPEETKWIVIPVVGMEESDEQKVAVLDLGSMYVKIGTSEVAWARDFSPVKLTPSPTSVADVVSIGDVVEMEIGSSESGELTLRLSQPPLVQGALVAIDPHERSVVAMIGGSDFRRSSFIRAVQAKRQPGSAFKPIVYTAAIQSGTYTPATVLIDSPEVYYDSRRGGTWKPGNFERVFLGPVSLRYALSHSINSVAVKIASQLGPDLIASTAKAMGINSDLQRNLSMALGSSEVTLLELTNTYTTLAANGIVQDPVFITSVVGLEGKEIESFYLRQPYQAVGAAEAYVMTNMLRSVVEEGTGRSALSLDRPIAGKTGTTNQQRDGWFVGYSPELVAGVWVGFDDCSPMGPSWAQGARTALPIWRDFMEQVLKETPKSDFPAPDNVVFIKVDPQNGLLATSRSTPVVFETFVEGTEPRMISDGLSICTALNARDVFSDFNCLPADRLPEEFYR